MKLLDNEILKLRALEPEDIDMFSLWENDSAYWKQGQTIAPYSRYALKQYIAAAQSDIYETKELKLVIVRICDNQAIGIVDLFNIDHYHSRLEFGIHKTIRHTFLWFSVFIIGKGLILGNIIGIGITLIQKYTGVIKLDAATYYVDTVPVELNIPLILILNVSTLLISLFVLIAPSYLISHIHPAKSMRYE